MKSTHIEGTGKSRRKAFEAEFVKVPARWVQALQGANGATYQLALVILSEAHKNKYLHLGVDITLSSEVTNMLPDTRRRAAKELAKRGLIYLVPLGNHASRAIPY